MAINAYRARWWHLIVYFAIGLCACKSKKPVSNESGFKELNTRFERLYIEACTQSNIGNYTTSLTQFYKCAEIKPDEASVYYQISKIKQKLKEDNAAFQNASKANSLAPLNKFYAMHYAAILKGNGDYKMALQVLETSLNANLKEENLYNAMDAILAVQNETDKRIALWSKYKENAGLKIGIGLKLVSLYKLKSDFASAHAMYDELKKAAPNKTQFYLEDAKLYEEQKDEVNANLNYEKAVQANPNNWEVNYALYQSYRKKNDITRSENYFRSAFEKSTVSFETRLPACKQLLKEVNTDTLNCRFSAIAANSLIRNYPADAKALFTAAELYNACGSDSKAFTNYESSGKINPNLFDAWKGAVNSAFKQKDYKSVIRVGESAIEYFPNTSSLYESLAKACNLDKQYEKAYEFAGNGERFAFENNDKAGLLLQKGLSLYHQGNYTESLKVTGDAITINQQNGELFDLLGNNYYFLKDGDKAVESWKTAKKLGCKNALIDKKIAERKVYE